MTEATRAMASRKPLKKRRHRQRPKRLAFPSFLSVSSDCTVSGDCFTRSDWLQSLVELIRIEVFRVRFTGTVALSMVMFSKVVVSVLFYFAVFLT